MAMLAILLLVLIVRRGMMHMCSTLLATSH